MHTRAWTHAHMYTHMLAYTCTRMCTHALTRVHTRAQTHAHTRGLTHTHTCTQSSGDVTAPGTVALRPPVVKEGLQHPPQFSPQEAPRGASQTQNKLGLYNREPS